MRARGGLAVVLILTSSCGLAENTAYRHFEGAKLTQGRVIWLANCEGCHGHGTAGAPIPMVPDDWRSRLLKPRDTLYSHAIEGFFGPDDTMMPPRGGNDSLTDIELRAAVDYMAALADFHLRQGE
jgi:cytochrome c5